MRRLFSVLLASAVVALIVGRAAADDKKPQHEVNPPPSTAEKKTVPGTGGYVWGSGQNSNAPPKSSGGSVGVQYPPDRGPTKTYCNGKPC